MFKLSTESILERRHSQCATEVQLVPASEERNSASLLMLNAGVPPAGKTMGPGGSEIVSQDFPPSRLRRVEPGAVSEEK